MPKIKPVTLDGSTLEGGGQLVRVALALSAITGFPVCIHSIRANRAPQGRHRPQGSSKYSRGASKSHDRNLRDPAGRSGGSTKVEGGLKESHLAALIWLAQRTNAYVEGAHVGSREVTFVPGIAQTRDGAVSAEQDVIRLERPGSVFLILQAIFPYLVFGNRQLSSSAEASSEDEATSVSLRIHGGTNVSNSMSAEYVSQVFGPVLSRIGFPAPQIEIINRGWAGSAPQVGEIKATVPRVLSTKELPTQFNIEERGDIVKVDISVVAYPSTTRDQIISRLSSRLVEHALPAIGIEPKIEVVLNEDSEDERRLYILLVAHTSKGWVLGRDFLGSGRRAKNAAEANKIVEEACTSVVKELLMEVKRGGCVDEYMSDQLGVFQGLLAHLAARREKKTKEEGTSIVNAGEWKDSQTRKVEDWEYSGDDAGTLHARTVRWVCERVMKDVRFAPGGMCTPVSGDAKDFGIGEVDLNGDEDET